MTTGISTDTKKMFLNGLITMVLFGMKKSLKRKKSLRKTRKRSLRKSTMTGFSMRILSQLRVLMFV